MKSKKFKCKGCSASFDHATKISRHWDSYPKHMTDVQKARRKYVGGVDADIPIPTVAKASPTQKAWRHCPWCGGALRRK